MNQPVAKLIKKREERDWSQTKAAAEMGFSQAYLAALESGRRPITGNALLRIADVYYGGRVDEARKDLAPRGRQRIAPKRMPNTQRRSA